MTNRFSSLAEFVNLVKELPAADQEAASGAADRNAQLTKPAGSLGKLEDIALWYAAWRGNARPAIEAPQVVIFAGNHGVCAQGVSAFPSEVTQQMVYNFQAGGAAINQLSKCFGAKLDVIALDLDTPTADFTAGPAMSEAELVAALQTGWDAVDENSDILITGEMGIGNTTAALRCLGGRELAAMAGAVVRARTLNIPVIMDGFICTAACATLHAMDPAALDHVIAGHASAEQAHQRMLGHLNKDAIIQMNMRLGEGSGAATALGIVKAAVACHSGMATFAEAGVAEG
jgi:nicotinate-nucleotide--dimethylbenzimidazole phosphoribosyltransferase